MSSRKRDNIYRHWSRVIQYETRDIAALDACCRRVLADRDVRAEPGLESALRVDIDNRRAEIQRDTEVKRSQANATMPETTHEAPAPGPDPAASPEQVQLDAAKLTRTLTAALESEDEGEARILISKIQAIDNRHPGILATSFLAKYGEHVQDLCKNLEILREQVADLTRQATSASQLGHEKDLARVLRKLRAISVAHPKVLDEAGLEKIRLDTLRATENRRQHQLTTQQLLDRERVIAGEIKEIAVVIRAFHHAARSAPATSEAFQTAEANYLNAIQQVKTYDAEWFTGVVLELADLLAEWTVPPPEAEGQISRFLDRIAAGLETIRAEIRTIDAKQTDSEINTSENGD